jgi:hypothetical protein
MDGRERSALPRILGAAKDQTLRRHEFRQDDSVRPVTQSRFEKVADRHRRQAFLLATGSKRTTFPF